MTQPWPTKRLRHLTSRHSHKDAPSHFKEMSEATFLSMDSIGEQGQLDLSQTRPVEQVQSGYSRFFDGDVVVAKITPCFENGKGALIRGTLNGVGFGTTELHVLTPGAHLDGKYLYYITIDPRFRHLGAATMTGTAGQQRVPEDFIRDFKVKVPSLTEQRAIADYLDRETAQVDALVAKKERMVALLVERRQALVANAVTCGVDSGAVLRDSGIPWLGHIPAHWEVKRLKHLGQATIGLTFDPSDAIGEVGGTLVLRASNIRDRKIVLEDKLYVSTSVPDALKAQVGDILLCSRSGSEHLIGKSALITPEVAGMTFGAFMTVFRSPHNEYLSYVFDSPLFQFQAGAFQTSTINQLTVETLNDMEVPLPPSHEQAAIVATLRERTSQMDRLVATMKRSIDLLEERRSALITATMTGQVEVPLPP